MQINAASFSVVENKNAITVETQNVKHGKQSRGLIDRIGSRFNINLTHCENLTSSYKITETKSVRVM